MSKHTPGPWEVHDYRHGDASAETWLGILRGAFDIDGKAHQIGQFRFSALPTEENWANARLIAAAPEMLAMLQELESAGWDRVYDEPCCPNCGELSRIGHKEYCRLAAVLKSLEGT